MKISSDQEQSMAYQGMSFYEAGYRCRQQVNLHSSAGQCELDTPTIVNYAFSIEVYLKLLLGETGGGHNLWCLYDRLKEPMKQQVLTCFENLRRPSADFEDRLKGIATAFEDWRYYYEKPPLSIGLDNVWDIAGAVQDAVRALKPALKRVG